MALSDGLGMYIRSLDLDMYVLVRDVNTLRTGSFKLFKLFKRPLPGFFNNFNPLNAELNSIG